MALEDYRKDMLRCTRCCTCKFIPLLTIFKQKDFSYCCPAISRYNFHSYSGSGKVITALSLLDKRIDYSDKFLHVVFNCTLCGACDLSCRVGTDIEIYEILHELRVRCFEDGAAPLDGHKPILESIKNYDNVWLQPRAKRGQWAKGLNLKDLNKEKADILYFAGCTYAYKKELSHVARNTAILLGKGGVDFGILGREEKCCASPAFTIGDMETFEKYALENIQTFNDLGVSKVVTSCAGCFGLMKSKYPRLGADMNFEVVHSIEIIDELIKDGKLKPKREVPLKVTYHDPCHLGRLSEPRDASEGKETKILGTLAMKEIDKVLGFNGVFDPPRDVLTSIPGVEFEEMNRIREYSFCCGSGAGVKSAFPEFALWTADERIQEARSTGAEALVSCCPWCEANLIDGARELGEEKGIRVLDATDLLMDSIAD